jgi:hypothetical protein
MGNLDPEGFLKAYGIDSNTPTKSRNDAYDIIKSEISKYTSGDLELKNMEHGFTGQTVYSDPRPLAGIKIVELGRVIALPAAGALLAALGAEVIAIQSPNLTNFGVSSSRPGDFRTLC